MLKELKKNYFNINAGPETSIVFCSAFLRANDQDCHQYAVDDKRGFSTRIKKKKPEKNTMKP